jgi:hypothetical protein
MIVMSLLFFGRLGIEVSSRCVGVDVGVEVNKPDKSNSIWLLFECSVSMSMSVSVSVFSLRTSLLYQRYHLFSHHTCAGSCKLGCGPYRSDPISDGMRGDLGMEGAASEILLLQFAASYKGKGNGGDASAGLAGSNGLVCLLFLDVVNVWLVCC